MTSLFTRVGRPISETELAEFEAQLGRQLPESYRRFLLTNNGGKPVRKLFRFRRKSGRADESAIREFFGARSGAEYDLSFYHRLYVAARRVPPDLFPIGDCGGGDLVLVGATGPRAGQIFYWDHNFESDEGAPPTEENVYFVAPSLEGFLEQLEPLENA
jgi:hypothetical protein